MDYPREFSAQARARVEAERLKANRELEQAQFEKPPADWPKSARSWDHCAFYAYILRVFRAFTREACELGKQGTWTVDRIRSHANEFLRRFTIEAYYERGHDRSGQKFPEMTSNWNGSLLSEVKRSFRDTDEWRGYEAELLDVAEAQASQKTEPKKPADSIIGRLPKGALIRMEAATAAFMADYLPKVEREGNKSGPLHDAELLRELVIHQFGLVARECMAVSDSPDHFEAEMRADIARFVHYGLSQYPWLADAMRQELDTGFTFFAMRANPWAQIPEAERASAWHVGAITGEALTHLALKLRAEALKNAAEGGFQKRDQAGTTQPGADKPNHTDAGPANHRTNPAESGGKGRKRGPKSDPDAASRVAEIVARVAPDGDWRPKLDVICDALDAAQIPFPPRWRKRDRSCDGWADYDERAKAVKAIEYRLEIAKPRKKPTLGTLS